MDRFHRYYRLDALLQARRLPVPSREIERALESSRATPKRVIEEMRNCGAPIDYVRDPGGYRYRDAQVFQLPRLWFTPAELLALLADTSCSRRASRGCSPAHSSRCARRSSVCSPPSTWASASWRAACA